MSGENRTLLAARPTLTDFTFTGQAADVLDADRSLPEEWTVTVGGGGSDSTTTAADTTPNIWAIALSGDTVFDPDDALNITYTGGTPPTFAEHDNTFVNRDNPIGTGEWTVINSLSFNPPQAQIYLSSPSSADAAYRDIFRLLRTETVIDSISGTISYGDTVVTFEEGELIPRTPSSGTGATISLTLPFRIPEPNNGDAFNFDITYFIDDHRVDPQVSLNFRIGGQGITSSTAGLETGLTGSQVLLQNFRESLEAMSVTNFRTGGAATFPELATTSIVNASGIAGITDGTPILMITTLRPPTGFDDSGNYIELDFVNPRNFNDPDHVESQFVEVQEVGNIQTSTQIEIDFNNAFVPQTLTIDLAGQGTTEAIADFIRSSVQNHPSFTASSSDSVATIATILEQPFACLLYTSPSPRDS